MIVKGKTAHVKRNAGTWKKSGTAFHQITLTGCTITFEVGSDRHYAENVTDERIGKVTTVEVGRVFAGDVQ